MRRDSTLPLGFRFRAKSSEDGVNLTHDRVEAAVHTICQLCDFGFMTAGHMEELMVMLRDAGVEFTHTPYGGKPLPRIVSG